MIFKIQWKKGRKNRIARKHRCRQEISIHGGSNNEEKEISQYFQRQFQFRENCTRRSIRLNFKETLEESNEWFRKREPRKRFKNPIEVIQQPGINCSRAISFTDINQANSLSFSSTVSREHREFQLFNNANWFCFRFDSFQPVIAQ